MSDVIELKKTVKQLQSAVNDQETISILNLLKGKHVTEAILRESKIGLAVGKLRMHKSKSVADLAKELVKHWKTQVEKAKGKTGSGSTPTPASGASDAGKKATTSTPITPTGGASTSLRTSKTDNVKGGVGDTTRDRCVELIYDAIACDATAPIELVLTKSQGIEKAVYTDMGGTTGAYKSKIRSLFVNLKDKANPGLRASIVDGSLSPEKFSKMTSQEMASEERKAADKKIQEENFFKSLSAAEKQAETDAFQCSRCKQRKCVYRQQQTRSADEPMTTFVTCTVCQNKYASCPNSPHPT
ncbi:transcription elongation factor [Pholiota conissans]|uniref:Transcription elongation factor n=1 Tax=Pholiota conissans TaxID=109636 RepID=A0A9P6D3A6_9AGAR|nr:transcription elongation factor [Pholiota conissans]